MFKYMGLMITGAYVRFSLKWDWFRVGKYGCSLS